MVRAVVDRVETGVVLGEEFAHAIVGVVDQLLGEVVAGDSRLVGNHDGLEPRLVRPAHRVGGTLEEPDPVDVVDVADLPAHRAVAIHDDRASLRCRRGG